MIKKTTSLTIQLLCAHIFLFLTSSFSYAQISGNGGTQAPHTCPTMVDSDGSIAVSESASSLTEAVDLALSVCASAFDEMVSTQTSQEISNLLECNRDRKCTHQSNNDLDIKLCQLEDLPGGSGRSISHYIPNGDGTLTECGFPESCLLEDENGIFSLKLGPTCAGECVIIYTGEVDESEFWGENDFWVVESSAKYHKSDSCILTDSKGKKVS